MEFGVLKTKYDNDHRVSRDAAGQFFVAEKPILRVTLGEIDWLHRPGHPTRGFDLRAELQTEVERLLTEEIRRVEPVTPTAELFAEIDARPRVCAAVGCNEVATLLITVGDQQLPPIAVCGAPEHTATNNFRRDGKGRLPRVPAEYATVAFALNQMFFGISCGLAPIARHPRATLHEVLVAYIATLTPEQRARVHVESSGTRQDYVRVGVDGVSMYQHGHSAAPNINSMLAALKAALSTPAPQLTRTEAIKARYANEPRVTFSTNDRGFHVPAVDGDAVNCTAWLSKYDIDSEWVDATQADTIARIDAALAKAAHPFGDPAICSGCHDKPHAPHIPLCLECHRRLAEKLGLTAPVEAKAAELTDAPMLQAWQAVDDELTPEQREAINYWLLPSLATSVGVMCALRQATGFEPHAKNQSSPTWAILWRDQFAEPIVVEVELTGVGGAVLLYRQSNYAHKSVMRVRPSDATVEKLKSGIGTMLLGATNYTGPRSA